MRPVIGSRKRGAIALFLGLGVATLLIEMTMYWLYERAIQPVPVLLGCLFLYIAGHMQDAKGTNDILKRGTESLVTILKVIPSPFGRRAADRAAVVVTQNEQTGETAVTVTEEVPIAEPADQQGGVGR